MDNYLKLILAILLTLLCAMLALVVIMALGLAVRDFIDNIKDHIRRKKYDKPK